MIRRAFLKAAAAALPILGYLPLAAASEPHPLQIAFQKQLDGFKKIGFVPSKEKPYILYYITEEKENKSWIRTIEFDGIDISTLPFEVIDCDMTETIFPILRNKS